MKFKKKTAAVAAALATLLALSACSGGGTEPEGNTSPNAGATDMADYNPQDRDKLQDGGTYTTAITTINNQWNPFQTDADVYTSQLWSWYNPQMAFFSAEGEYTPNPDYLSDVKMTVENDKTVMTYTINPKAKYNDGTAMDWTSFENTWKANSGQDPKYLVSATDGYSQIESVKEGENAQQAIVTFKGIYAWPNGLFNNVLHPKVKTSKQFNEMYLNEPNPEMGAGPFIIDKVDTKGGTVSFKHNDKWWGDPGKLESRVFKVLEPTAAINAFKNGQIDSTDVGTKDRLAQVKDMQDITIRRAGSTSNSLFTLPADNPLLKDVNVRKAIMMGIDRKTLADVVFNGLDYEEEPPGSFSLFGFQEGYEDNFGKNYKFDVEGAKKLLDEAGFVAGEDGIRAKDGKKLSLSMPQFGDDPTGLARAKAMNAMLKDIGVDLVIDQKPASEFSTTLAERDYDVLYSGFASSDPYGFAYFDQLYGSDSGLNRSGTGTKEMDKKIDELAKIADPAEQIKQGNVLEAEIMNEAWGIMPIMNGPTIVATKKGLANIGPESYTGPDLFGVRGVQDVGWVKE